MLFTMTLTCNLLTHKASPTRYLLSQPIRYLPICCYLVLNASLMFQPFPSGHKRLSKSLIHTLNALGKDSLWKIILLLSSCQTCPISLISNKSASLFWYYRCSTELIQLMHQNCYFWFSVCVLAIFALYL